MCLSTEIKEQFIAEEDMTVYKGMSKREDINGIVYYVSHIKQYEYIPNELYQTEILPETKVDSTFYDVRAHEYYKYNDFELKHWGQGFHFCFTKERCNWLAVECVVPKGSLYYKDSTGLGISNQIIIKGRIL